MTVSKTIEDHLRDLGVDPSTLTNADRMTTAEVATDALSCGTGAMIRYTATEGEATFAHLAGRLIRRSPGVVRFEDGWPASTPA